MANLPALETDQPDLPTCSTTSADHRPAKTRLLSATGRPLTRFGIYKIVRRLAGHLDDARTNRSVSPHLFRHTAAVHLLESGVEVNVIRGWLGHADLSTTNRYAEINTRAKIEALRNTEPPGEPASPALTPSGGPTRTCSTGCPRSEQICARRQPEHPAPRARAGAGHITGGT